MRGIRRANTGHFGRTTPTKRKAYLTAEQGPVETSSRPGPRSQLPHLLSGYDPSGPTGPSRAGVRPEASRQVKSVNGESARERG